jgi:hypothetical protein
VRNVGHLRGAEGGSVGQILGSEPRKILTVHTYDIACDVAMMSVESEKDGQTQKRK